MGWTPAQLPDLSDKTYVITGGNSGLGHEASKILVAKGAKVVITARSEDKAKAAMEAVRAQTPGADIGFVALDLSVQASVKEAAARLVEDLPRIDAVINNAGVMQTPERRTDEGWELQLATNHIGHFKLDSLLFPTIEASKGRIVAVSSIAHKFGKIDLDDLHSEKSYDPTRAYSQSKLANIMYAFELQRRLTERESPATAYASHPGYSDTNLQTAGVGMEGGSWFFRGLYSITNKVMAQTAEQGSYPLVLAAAWPEAEPGAYYGPTGLADTRGPVGKSTVAERARDKEVARQLWERTEDLVGPFFAD